MPKAIPMPPASSTPSLAQAPTVTSRLSETLRITGTVIADEDLVIAAAITGAVSAPGHCVVVSDDARLHADILARDLTVQGEVTGRLTATEIVDVRASGHVQGTIAAPRIVLELGGVVQGRIETKPVDAAVRVAQYRRRQ
jgi:cytoskeletal protein CcmA (bactofilin family)